MNLHAEWLAKFRTLCGALTDLGNEGRALRHEYDKRGGLPAFPNADALATEEVSADAVASALTSLDALDNFLDAGHWTNFYTAGRDPNEQG